MLASVTINVENKKIISTLKLNEIKSDNLKKDIIIAISNNIRIMIM